MCFPLKPLVRFECFPQWFISYLIPRDRICARHPFLPVFQIKNWSDTSKQGAWLSQIWVRVNSASMLPGAAPCAFDPIRYVAYLRHNTINQSSVYHRQKNYSTRVLFSISRKQIPHKASCSVRKETCRCNCWKPRYFMAINSTEVNYTMGNKNMKSNTAGCTFLRPTENPAERKLSYSFHSLLQ